MPPHFPQPKGVFSCAEGEGVFSGGKGEGVLFLVRIQWAELATPINLEDLDTFYVHIT